jgi:hypothetical protein
MARMTSARTTHGKCSARQRAMERSVRTLPVRVRLYAAALLLKQYLLAEMAARLSAVPVGLKAPAFPDNRVVLKNPDTTPCNSLPAVGLALGRAGGKARLVLPAREAERLALLAEAAGQAPWRQAIALARAGGAGGCAGGGVCPAGCDAG